MQHLFLYTGNLFYMFNSTCLIVTRITIHKQELKCLSPLKWLCTVPFPKGCVRRGDGENRHGLIEHGKVYNFITY